MDNENNIKDFKKMCWDKAKELNKDESKTIEYFNWLKTINYEKYQKAIVWCVNAYYEFLQNNWSKSKCESQINDAICVAFH